MESLKYLEELKLLPTDDKYENIKFADILKELKTKKSTDVSIEVACSTESIMVSLFKNRNVPDSITEAYKASFTGSDITLYDHYQTVLAKGADSTKGFIHNIKGKVFEVQLQENLKDVYPGYEFSIAENPINPIWDIKGINISDGSEILIQAKMGGVSYSSDVISRMNDNPEVLFAVSKEIHEKIVSAIPELSEKFVDIDVSNYDFSEELKKNLGLLINNFGINVPDSLGDILPYIGDIILGIRLIIDLINVQRDFKQISITDKTKISGIKAIALLSRFGVSTVCTTVGSAAGTAGGTAIPAIGNVAGGITGGIAGAVLASQLNKHFKPYIMDFALGITGLNNDDLFYLRNKAKINDIALSILNTKP